MEPACRPDSHWHAVVPDQPIGSRHASPHEDSVSFIYNVDVSCCRKWLKQKQFYPRHDSCLTVCNRGLSQGRPARPSNDRQETQRVVDQERRSRPLDHSRALEMGCRFILAHRLSQAIVPASFLPSTIPIFFVVCLRLGIGRIGTQKHAIAPKFYCSIHAPRQAKPGNLPWISTF
jgi:hypothetical protein